MFDRFIRKKIKGCRFETWCIHCARSIFHTGNDARTTDKRCWLCEHLPVDSVQYDDAVRTAGGRAKPRLDAGCRTTRRHARAAHGRHVAMQRRYHGSADVQSLSFGQQPHQHLHRQPGCRRPGRLLLHHVHRGKHSLANWDSCPTPAKSEAIEYLQVGPTEIRYSIAWTTFVYL